MVFILNESAAQRIFTRYRNVAGIALGKSKGFSDNGLEISYSRFNMLPDDDTINAVVQGDLKAKKVIKEAVKQVMKPKTKNQTACMTMAQLINIIAPNKEPKGGPNVLVFVLDDHDSGDQFGKKRDKFLIKYITALFQVFGVEPVTDEKTVKRVFKKKGKKVAKKIAKYMLTHKEARLNKDGMRLKQELIQYFAIELHQSSLSQLDIDDLGKKTQENLVKSLVDVYTNDNLENIAKLGLDDKDEKKVMKNLRKKNRLAVKQYKQLRKILSEMDPDTKFPKVESGYSKKGKKKGNDKPLMNKKKFTKFYSKNKNMPYLALIYAHTATLNCGVEFGTSEYTKLMNKTISNFGDADEYSVLAKEYTSMVKTWMKDKEAAKTSAN